MSPLRRVVALAAACVAVASGCFWSAAETRWVSTARNVEPRKVGERPVTSDPAYRLGTSAVASDGGAVSVSVVRSVLTRTETTYEDHELTPMREEKHRKLNSLGKRLRTVTALAAAALIADGAVYLMQTETPGRDEVDARSKRMMIGAVLMGVSSTRYVTPSARTTDTGATRTDERVLATRSERSAPVEAALPAAGAEFRVAVAPPLVLAGASDVAADGAGVLRVELGVSPGWYRTAREARAATEALPEIAELTESGRSSKTFRDLVENRGVVSRRCEVSFEPRGATDRERQQALATPLTAYAPARAVAYRAAADFCDAEVNAKTRHIALSVRDAATRLPVAAAVELEVTAPSPEEILQKYLSGDLLRQAIARAAPYARGKVSVAAAGELTFVTLFVPCTVAYRVSADGYRPAAGTVERLEHGPLLIDLERARAR
jgi:hypothetical protein